ncbi:MAG TPA: TlpA disulfide reductase family protein [Prolixibacteraceae bacterium]|nr:TlpA disulfide reductase family protein [Prolixibacteraceae bacterium]
MKKLFPVILFLALILGCKKHDGFVISGKITNAEGKYLYIDELKVASSVPLDSVKIKKDGTFEFKGKISYPNFFLLRLGEKNFVTLLVDSTENIQVYGDAATFSRDYVVEGSPGSLLVQELNEQLTKTKQKLDSIRSLVKVFPNQDISQKIRWDQELTDIVKTQIEYSTMFVQKHPFSMASVLALYQKFDDSNYVIQDLQSLKVAATALNTIFPKSEHVKALYANTKRLMEQEKNNKLREYILNNGTNSPDVVLPNPNGRDVALSSLKGKIVLLQFWGAEDRTSRIQNQALKELYGRYKSRGFEIYQVSIDTNRSVWVNAIEQDQLSWINVGDMEGSVKALHTYNIQRIPSNYILDREGMIVGRDLQGPDLNRAVDRLTK